MRSHFQHDGRLTSYHDVAPAGSPPARTLVLLHAFPLAADMWAPQLAAAPPGWRVVAPDFRGFGASSPDPASVDPLIDDYAGDVLALLDHLALDRVVVGGLSMGGYAAFALMRLAPDRVQGIVLADTRAGADGEAARASRGAMLEVLDRGGVAAVFERMQPGLFGRTTMATRPDVVEGIRRLALAQSVAGVGRAIERLRSRPDSTPLLATMSCPTLVVVGEEDQITGLGDAQAMHDRIPMSELIVIGRAGHLSNVEQPREFNAALTRFLTARF
jgi:3-oxoadipate enol-lactonase